MIIARASNNDLKVGGHLCRVCVSPRLIRSQSPTRCSDVTNLPPSDFVFFFPFFFVSVSFTPPALRPDVGPGSPTKISIVANFFSIKYKDE